MIDHINYKLKDNKIVLLHQQRTAFCGFSSTNPYLGSVKSLPTKYFSISGLNIETSGSRHPMNHIIKDDYIGPKRCESTCPTDFSSFRVYLWNEITHSIGLAYRQVIGLHSQIEVVLSTRKRCNL